MIPYTSDLGELMRTRLPEATFYLDEETGTVRGMTDGAEATRQAAWLILHTERYRHLIYSYNYGTELMSLSGSPDSFLFPEIKRRVTEALTADDRISGTSNFAFSHVGSRVSVSFTLHTVYGDTELAADI